MELLLVKSANILKTTIAYFKAIRNSSSWHSNQKNEVTLSSYSRKFFPKYNNWTLTLIPSKCSWLIVFFTLLRKTQRFYRCSDVFIWSHSLVSKHHCLSSHSTNLIPHARFLCRKQARSCLVSCPGQSERGGPYDASAHHLPLTDLRCWCSLPSAVLWRVWRDDKESCKVLNFWIVTLNGFALPNPLNQTQSYCTPLWDRKYPVQSTRRVVILFILKQSCG